MRGWLRLASACQGRDLISAIGDTLTDPAGTLHLPVIHTQPSDLYCHTRCESLWLARDTDLNHTPDPRDEHLHRIQLLACLPICLCLTGLSSSTILRSLKLKHSPWVLRHIKRLTININEQRHDHTIPLNE